MCCGRGIPSLIVLCLWDDGLGRYPNDRDLLPTGQTVCLREHVKMSTINMLIETHKLSTLNKYWISVKELGK